MESRIYLQLNKAEEIKAQANEFFKQQKYKRAIVYYSRVVAYTTGLPGSKSGLTGIEQMAAEHVGGIVATPDELERASTLESVVHCNIALCHLKLNDPRAALDSSNKSLALCPTNWKAMLRKAEALLVLQDSEKARKAITEAARMTTEETALVAIRSVESRLLTLEKRESDRQKKAYAGIFDKANAN